MTAAVLAGRPGDVLGQLARVLYEVAAPGPSGAVVS